MGMVLLVLHLRFDVSDRLFVPEFTVLGSVFLVLLPVSQCRGGIDVPAQNGEAGHLPSAFFFAILWLLGGTYEALGRTEEMRKRFNAQDASSHAHLVPGPGMV
jgi:hypothetical protein